MEQPQLSSTGSLCSAWKTVECGVCGCLVLVLAMPGSGQQVPAANPEAAAITPISAGAAPAVQAEIPLVETAAALPAPFQHLETLGQTCATRWRQLYRMPSSEPITDRMKIAFALGMTVADAYLACQARDGQHLRNLTGDLQNFATTLGVTDSLPEHRMQILRAAEEEKWPDVNTQLASLSTRLDTTFNDQRDHDLAKLMRIGLWIRLMEISSTAISENPDAKKLELSIGSVPLLESLHEEYKELSPETVAMPAWQNVDDELIRLIQRWKGRSTPATMEDVAASKEKISNLIRKIYKHPSS